MTNRRSIVWMLAAAAGFSATVLAHADDKDKAPLSGPRVKDHGPPGERRTLAGRPGRAGEGVQARVFNRAMRVLEADDAPEQLRLSVEQRQQLEAIRSDFEAQMQAYRDAHKAELLALREKLPERERRRVDGFLEQRGEVPPRDGARPGPRERRPGDAMQDAPMEDLAEADRARERLREIVAAAPRPDDAHMRVMGVLNDAQRDAVKKEVERLTTEAGNRMQHRPGAPDRDRPALSPEQREKLKEMSPEERRDIVRDRMKERQREGESGRKPK